MDLYRQEVRAFFLGPILDEVSERLGPKPIERILGALGISRREIDDPSVWVSLELCEAVCEALAKESNDPAFFERSGRNSFSAKYMGALRPIIRAFGNPAFAYDQMVGSLPRFNKVGQIAVLTRGPGLRVLEYRVLPGAAREKGPYICAARRGQMAALPTLFDLPPAQVDHSQCMQRGAETCLYRIEWREPPRRRLGALLASGVPAVAAASTAVALGVAAPFASMFAIAAGALGWLVRRNFELRADLGDRLQDLLAHNDALLSMAQANEARVLALTEAKANVEETVEMRTRALREASARLEEALARVQSLSEARNRFFANVSHELRTPLQLILAPLDDLVKGRAPPGGSQRALETMARSAGRLRELIDQLLDLARLEAGRVTLDRRPTNLCDVIAGVVDMFSIAAERQGVLVEKQIPSEPLVLSLDRSWIESALTNLLSNALRVSARGSSVVVQVAADLRGAVITVRDRGPGMSDSRSVFGRFVQGREGRGSVGLGLAIVEETARLHGGEVKMESGPERGTSISIILPRGTGELSTAQAVGRQGSAPLTRAADQVGISITEPPPPESLPGPTPGAPLALVVEDEDDLRGYVLELVSSRCRVLAAKDGAQAIALFDEHHPDVVVTDIAMPQMDGLELTREIRARTEAQFPPSILLLTARQTPADIAAGYEAGADDYVSKPFDPTELRARLDVQLRLRQLVVEAAARERLASLGLLAAEVAHGIRNPLNVIQNAFALVQRAVPEPPPETARRGAVLIEQCIGRIHDLTRELLDLSGVEKDALAPLSPGEALESVCRMISTILPEGAHIETELDTSVRLVARARDLSLLFVNILDNAAKAVGKGGTIRVHGRRDGDEWVVDFEDSGPGLDPKIASRIFEPFVTSRAPGEGTGLGLSIARRIAEQHGGRLAADRSDRLGGARITARIPLERGERS